MEHIQSEFDRGQRDSAMDFERLDRALSEGHVSAEALSDMCRAEHYEAASAMNFLKGCLDIMYGVAQYGRPI